MCFFNKKCKSNFRNLLTEYVQRTTFHGYRYLVENDIHWSEKLFWLIICILSFIASGFLMRASWQNYQTNALSFVTDTNHLEWDTKFPSISVCEVDNPGKIAEISDMLFGDPHDYTLDEIMKELLFFKGLSYYTFQICGSDKSKNNNCYVANITYYENLVRSSCNDIFLECKWNHISFECCKYFTILNTEIGPCYVINSLQSRSENSPHFPMISNRKNGPGTLKLRLNGYLNVYIMGEQEVPTLTTLANDFLSVTPSIYHKRHISIKEIENENKVKETSLQQRKCRFKEENFLEVHRFYSYGACTVQCRKNIQIQRCNCIHHLIPGRWRTENICDVKGLKCLHDNYNKIAVLKAPWVKKKGLVCQCLPSCDEVEITTIRETKIGTSNQFATVEISLEHLPTERYKRNVVRGKLELVVSLGGAAALLLGASVLSVFEIIYFLFLRVPTSVKQKNKI